MAIGCWEILFNKTSCHIETSQYAKQICCIMSGVYCLSTALEILPKIILPKQYLKKSAKKQLNFSGSVFSSMWKTVIFHHFFRLSSPKVLYKAVLLFIIEVPYKSVLLSIITCRLSLTYHTQKYFIKALYYLVKM